MTQLDCEELRKISLKSARAQMEKIRINKESELLDDPELDHENADALLCAVLLHYGENELVENFIKLTRWYA
ncbi:MAG: hypothetical protein V6Z86_05480 [Hyphomicrobiales bacterium]